MNITGKFVFALAIVAGLATSAVAANLARHSPVTSSVPTIRLDAVVVTPADAAPETIELAAIRVTPADVEPETIALAPVTVTPTEADWLYAEAHGVNRPTKAFAPISEADGEFGVAPVVIQDLAAFKPGQYLNTSAALRLLDALVFGDEGR